MHGVQWQVVASQQWMASGQQRSTSYEGQHQHSNDTDVATTG